MKERHSGLVFSETTLWISILSSRCFHFSRFSQAWKDSKYIPFLTGKKTWIYLIFFFFCLFRATHMTYGSSQARDWIWAAVAGLHHSHSKIGFYLSPVCDLHHSSWHWVGPGIKPASSWILIGFITAEPQWEYLPENWSSMKWKGTDKNAWMLIPDLMEASSFITDSEIPPPHPFKFLGPFPSSSFINLLCLNFNQAFYFYTNLV